MDNLFLTHCVICLYHPVCNSCFKAGLKFCYILVFEKIVYAYFVLLHISFQQYKPAVNTSGKLLWKVLDRVLIFDLEHL